MSPISIQVDSIQATKKGENIFIRKVNNFIVHIDSIESENRLLNEFQFINILQFNLISLRNKMTSFINHSK